MKTICLSAVFLIFIGSSILANVPAPTPPPPFGLTLDADYPDYVFYFCKYYVVVEDGKRTGQIEVEQIDFTREKPFIIKKPRDSSNLKYFKKRLVNETDKLFTSNREDYLVAIKSEINSKFKPEAENKLLQLIENNREEAGIYYKEIPYKGIECSPCRGNFKEQIYVKIISNSGLVLIGKEDLKSDFIDDSSIERERNFRTIAVLVGVGLGISIFIAAVGIYFFTRKRKIA